jgi:hypothetical protein
MGAEVVALDVKHTERGVMHLFETNQRINQKWCWGREALTLQPPSPPTLDATSMQKATRLGQSARKMRALVLK